MIHGENISHFEFLGPHVVISKVKIWPIFVVWKKNSKIHVSGSKFEKLRFFKKFLRDQSHFFTQSSGINFSWNHQKKSKNYCQKKTSSSRTSFFKRWISRWYILSKLLFSQWNLKNWSKSRTETPQKGMQRLKKPGKNLGLYFSE